MRVANSTISEGDKDMREMVYFLREEGKVCEVAMKKIKVIALDDHPLMTKMVEIGLSGESDIEVVGTASHSSQLMQLVRKTDPDVVILDLSMDNDKFKPVSAIETLKREFPKIQIFILTMSEDRAMMIKLTRSGVLGYVLKTDQELSMRLADGVRTVYRGNFFYSSEVIEALTVPLPDPFKIFTAQEVEIILLVAQGFQNKAIGQALGLAAGSVANKLSEMYHKAGLEESEEIHARIALVNYAKKSGLIPKDT